MSFEEPTAWRTAVDPNTQKVYYWNIVTREARWKKPIELASPSERAEMIKKEKAQKEFFAEMERNIRERMQQGGLIAAAACTANPPMAVQGSLFPNCAESPGSILTEAPYDEVFITPNNEDERLQIQESWVQSWIDNSSPLTGLDDADLSLSSSSPMSTSSCSITSCGSERNDTVMPLKNESVNTSELISCRMDKAINKPKLVRTISKMEYDLTLLLKGIEENSPTSVDNLLSPGDRPTSDLLASLCITHEEDGVGCNLLHPLEMSPGSTSSTSTVGETDVTGPSCELAKPNLTKRNTCGTIYLGSTLSTPDKDALIKCVCGVYRAHLLQSSNTNTEESGDFRIFDDDYGSSRRLSRHQPLVPTLEDITNFYRDVFTRSQMEMDCIVISLIYIERLIKLSRGRLHPMPLNWKSILFSCMVLSSKVWDDLSMWNADFSRIGPGGVTFSLQRTNELEIALLTALEYKVKVGASEYAKYYFLLRSMLCRSGLAQDNLTTLNPLDADGVKSLEKTGASFENLGVPKPFVRVRSKSLSDVDASQKECEGSFRTKVAVSPKLLPHKVSLEHLVRM
jgi:hypothetical protein